MKIFFLLAMGVDIYTVKMGEKQHKFVGSMFISGQLSRQLVMKQNISFTFLI
jgi:hypothetical protein